MSLYSGVCGEFREHQARLGLQREYKLVGKSRTSSVVKLIWGSCGFLEESEAGVVYLHL